MDVVLPTNYDNILLFDYNLNLVDSINELKAFPYRYFSCKLPVVFFFLKWTKAHLIKSCLTLIPRDSLYNSDKEIVTKIIEI